MKTVYAALTGLALFGLTGCSTYTEQSQSMNNYWKSGNYSMAAADFGKKADKQQKGKDALIWRLEQATALRAAGQIQESVTAFDQAAQVITKYENKAKNRIGAEAAATMSNQANLPYEGRAYDKIMLDTYQALNYLELGDGEKARVELNRVYQRQQEAVADNARRLEKAQAEGKPTDKELAAKAREDGKFQGQLTENYGELDGMKSYGDYVNPFAVYLDGLYFMAAKADGSDLEHSLKSLQRVQEFVGDTRFIQQDLTTVSNVMNGQPLPATTYVVFETGSAPSRDQIRIDIPIIVAKVSYVGAAFPKLVFHHDQSPELIVTASGQRQGTELLCSLDSVVAKDFKNELPIVITKTMISTIAKAAAAYMVNETADRQDPMIGLLSKIGTAVAQMAVNIADTRTWTTLPKEFQVCRVATPADRRLQVATPSGQRADVTIGDGTVNVIVVKSVTASTPLKISQFKLK